jgi:hypothetical protein
VSIYKGSYPQPPGYKARQTSRDAAAGIAPKAQSLRVRCYEALKERPGTAEDLAERLGAPVMNIRPRLSECANMGLIRDTGRRGPASGGQQAIIWEIVP